VHATAEPVQTLDAGWDVAAIGEGETTVRKLVDAGGDPTGVPGLAYRNSNGDVVKTGLIERLPLDTFRAFSLRWNRFSALEITRGCAYACQNRRQLLSLAKPLDRLTGETRDDFKVLVDVEHGVPSALGSGGDHEVGDAGRTMLSEVREVCLHFDRPLLHRRRQVFDRHQRQRRLARRAAEFPGGPCRVSDLQ